MRLALGESSGISRLLQPNETHTTATREVGVVSIDQIAPGSRPDAARIKVDVEGAELLVLRGARSTVAAAGPGLQLFVEMHPHLWAALGISAEDVRRECEAQSLVAERLDGICDQNLWQIEGVCCACVRQAPASPESWRRRTHEDCRRPRLP